MLRSLRSRRRPRHGAQLCAVISALLLLLSVSLLYSRLSSSPHHRIVHRKDAVSLTSTTINQNPLLSDDSSNDSDSTVDKIDELDTFEDQKDPTGFRNDNNAEDPFDDENGLLQNQIKKTQVSTSGYFVDHITGSIRRAFNNKRSIEEWDYDSNSFGVVEDNKKGKAVFGSDDVPIDEEVRRKVNEVDGIEDALLLKIGKRVSPLREGWGEWFDKKGDFLRRDRMFKSNLEVLNPLNNPLLQDPDAVGVTGLTRGDKVVQKLLFNEFKKNPFVVKKPSRVLKMTTREDEVEDNSHDVGIRKSGGVSNAKDGIKMVERRTFGENMNAESNGKKVSHADDEKSNMIQGDNLSNSIKDSSGNFSIEDSSAGEVRKTEGIEKKEGKITQRQPEELSYIYPDGKRWGYFPGLHPHLSFLDFVDSFFMKEKCDMRVFMVWNSPPWMYSVRHQRGLESLLYHHKDACVIILSETIELDFFSGNFVKDGYKVAVAMPNLDELLKDTPAHIFADVWSDWRKTKFYPTHYSELIRLAALYKFGGIYLDSDIIVLNPLSSLDNTVGLEGQIAGSSLNGAVMAFRKNSPFLLECMKEFYITYDDTLLKWNGADLLTRVGRKFLNTMDKSLKLLELKLQPYHIFFPISSQDITSYFTAPGTETEKARQDALFSTILSESLTFHFWSSLTSALIPEPGSLVARLLNQPCIHCFDVL